MFSTEFEIILIIILAGVTLLLLLGHGDFLLKTKNDQRKRSPEEQKKFGRQIACFTGIWMIAEIVLMLFGSVQGVTIGYIIVVLATMVGLIIFSKKNM